MAEITVLGAGLGGTLMAYELAGQLRTEDNLSLISKGATYQFYPSNPWVAIGWRRRKEIEIDLKPAMQRRNINFITVPAARVDPKTKSIQLIDGTKHGYDYLVVATGPELAFDEVPGLGPNGYTQSICETAHAETAFEMFERFCQNPGPAIIGAAQGASCFGPAYEFALILDTELRKRKIRDQVPMTFVTPEPYIGHLGLDGVGDTKGLLESEFRNRHVKWITNARVTGVEPNVMAIEELNEDSSVKSTHELPFAYSMMMPAFRGVPAIFGIESLVNARGFMLTDSYQRNPTYRDVFSVGVCVAIPPVGKTPVPVGVPKTGYMIESMVAATAKNIGLLLRGREPDVRPTWNAICLADFGDSGVAFVAQPQIPPRNVNWAAQGKWVHLAKVAFERYFLRKIKAGTSELFFERYLLKQLDIPKTHPPKIQ